MGSFGEFSNQAVEGTTFVQNVHTPTKSELEKLIDRAESYAVSGQSGSFEDFDRRAFNGKSSTLATNTPSPSVRSVWNEWGGLILLFILITSFLSCVIWVLKGKSEMAQKFRSFVMFVWKTTYPHLGILLAIVFTYTLKHLLDLSDIESSSLLLSCVVYIIFIKSRGKQPL